MLTPALITTRTSLDAGGTIGHEQEHDQVWRRLEAAAAAAGVDELIEAAIAAGIRLIDTSPMYGAAERLISVALDGHRDQVLIRTATSSTCCDLSPPTS